MTAESRSFLFFSGVFSLSVPNRAERIPTPSSTAPKSRFHVIRWGRILATHAGSRARELQGRPGSGRNRARSSSSHARECPSTLPSEIHLDGVALPASARTVHLPAKTMPGSPLGRFLISAYANPSRRPAAGLTQLRFVCISIALRNRQILFKCRIRSQISLRQELQGRPADRIGPREPIGKIAKFNVSIEASIGIGWRTQYGNRYDRAGLPPGGQTCISV